jgi:arsenate reductase
MITLWYNPRCSKCRQAKAILDEMKLEYKEKLYLKDILTKYEISKLFNNLKQNGLSDIREMLRDKEEAYKLNDIKNNDKNDNEIIDLIISNPILLKRPIAQNNNANAKSIIAIPPELLKEF